MPRGRIAIQAPEGTSCVITETEAPDGYDLPADPSVTLVAGRKASTIPSSTRRNSFPPPALARQERQPDAGSGYVDSLTTTVGTTVFYRIRSPTPATSR